MNAECFQNMIKHAERVTSYDISHSWANGRVAFLFSIVGFIIQVASLVYLQQNSETSKLKTRILCTVTMFLLAHLNNVRIGFLYLRKCTVDDEQMHA